MLLKIRSNHYIICIVEVKDFAYTCITCL